MNKEKLAELTGVILGDGHLHKKQNLLTITGSLEDFHYYQKVAGMIFGLFNKKPNIRRRNDRNSFYIMIYSKEMIELFSDLPSAIENRLDSYPLPHEKCRNPLRTINFCPAHHK